MSWIAVGVSAVGTIGGALASKQKAPQAASYQKVNVQEEQARALAGNAANFDAAAALTARGNAAAQSQANALMEQAMPGYGALQKKLLAQASGDLNSENSLPPEMQEQIQRYAAEKGVTRGTAGNFNGFSLVKDFGFNLVDYQQATRARALNTLSTVFGMAPRVNVMSPMSMMVDPNTAIQVAGQNNQMQYNVEQGAYNAQMAARNHNASLTGGMIQSLGAIGASGYTQWAANRPPKTPAATPPAVNLPAPDSLKLPPTQLGLLQSSLSPRG